MLALAHRNDEPLAARIAACRTELLHRARNLVGSTEAEDLVQSTIERALLHVHTFQRGTNLFAWLRRIMSNLMIDSWRRRSLLTCALDEPAAPEPEPRAAWRELSDEDLLAAVARLPPSFRTVWELYTGGTSYAEIARRLGVPSPTVGTRLMRARLHLRTTLLATLARRRARLVGSPPRRIAIEMWA
jgi:RNA polymerase sigma-70 factor (ECF subfamily)